MTNIRGVVEWEGNVARVDFTAPRSMVYPVAMFALPFVAGMLAVYLFARVFLGVR